MGNSHPPAPTYVWGSLSGCRTTSFVATCASPAHASTWCDRGPRARTWCCTSPRNTVIVWGPAHSSCGSGARICGGTSHRATTLTACTAVTAGGRSPRPHFVTRFAGGSGALAHTIVWVSSASFVSHGSFTCAAAPWLSERSSACAFYPESRCPTVPDPASLRHAARHWTIPTAFC